jgi:hypothetical protein
MWSKKQKIIVIVSVSLIIITTVILAVKILTSNPDNTFYKDTTVCVTVYTAYGYASRACREVQD